MDFSQTLDTHMQNLLDNDTQVVLPDDLQQYLTLDDLDSLTPVSSPYGSPSVVHLPGSYVSTVFNPTLVLDAFPVDVIFVSNEGTLFTVHRHRILALSSNHLNALLPEISFQDNAIVSIPEPTEILNILLHAIYGLSVANERPVFACLSETVAAFRKYGLDRHSLVAPGQPLYDALLFIAPLNPIETYALAASEDLEDLAVAVSPYTLNTKLHLIPSTLIEKMGVTYLHRLQVLQGTRMDTLKELLSVKIFPHVATPRCSAADRQVTSRAFELAGSQIFYEATPAFPPTTIEAAFNNLIKGMKCPDCRKVIKNQVENIITEWMLLKRTI